MSGELNLPTALLHALDALAILPPNTEVVRNALGKWVARSVAVSPKPLDKLGPFGVKKAKVFLAFSSKQEASMYRVDFRTKLSMLDEWVIPSGSHGPIGEITWNEQTRQVAGIPAEATHFCWCYPPTGIIGLEDERKTYIDRCIKAGDPEFTFLAFGGFVYFKKTEQNTLQIIRANALVRGDTGLTFDAPVQWRPEFTACLFRQGRFENVTIQSLKDIGLQLYCYINPNEELMSESGEVWVPCPNGGFIYLYNASGDPHPLDRYFSLATSLSPPPDGPQSLAPLSIMSRLSVSQTVQDQVTAPQPVIAQVSPPTQVRDKPGDQSKKDTPTTGPMCVVCLDRIVGCIFLPCKHICACTLCGASLSKNSRCPMCRGEIRESWNVFL